MPAIITFLGHFSKSPPKRSLEKRAYAYHDYYLLQLVDQSESRVNVANAYKRGKKGRTGNTSEVKNTFPLPTERRIHTGKAVTLVRIE